MNLEVAFSKISLLFVFALILVNAKTPPAFAQSLGYSDIPPGLTIVSEPAANALFTEVVSHKEIPFDFPEGCFAKAHKIDLLLEQKGIIAGKAFVEGDIFMDSRWAESFWTFHVAPLILVRVGAAVRPYILDPLLSPNRIVSYENWLALVKQDRRTTLAKEYFTNRFIYVPAQKDLNLTHYDADSLRDMDMTLDQLRKRIPAMPLPPAI